MKPVLVLLLATAASLAAAVPPPEKLLPADALGVVTIPDFAKARTSAEQSYLARFWKDTELKAFREKIAEKWKNDVVLPLERELGARFADYLDLAQGQVTFAVTRNGWDGKSEQRPGILLLVDTRDKSDQLKTQLAGIRKKWVDSGKNVKIDKIRDTEFVTLMVSREDIAAPLKKAFPKAAGANDADDTESKKVGLMIGQSGPLLLLGTQTADLEKVLIRLGGGLAPALAEQPVYEANRNLLFRDAFGYAWLNVPPLVDALLQKAAAQNEPGAPGRPPFSPDKAVAALGFKDLKSVALSFSQPAGDGFLFNLLAYAPDPNRRGIFKLFNFEAKESAPPAFVPADAVKFARWRIDGRKSWAALEAMLGEISPEIAGTVQFMLNSAGKDKDPNFDFKNSFIANLGDDFVSYQKAPRGQSLLELSSPPTIYLLGSPNPDRLAVALKTAGSIFVQEGGGPKEREFLGRKIYSLPLPAQQLAGPEATKAPGPERSLNFSASGGYLAFSTDVALLEEHLRSAESRGRPLTQTPGILEAAQKVGGMNRGFFAFENYRETIRPLFEAIKKDPQLIEKSFPQIPGANPGAAFARTIKEWADFTLLPPFDRVAKYFHFTVYSGIANSDGFLFQTYNPTPPELKK